MEQYFTHTQIEEYITWFNSTPLDSHIIEENQIQLFLAASLCPTAFGMTVFVSKHPLFGISHK